MQKQHINKTLVVNNAVNYAKAKNKVQSCALINGVTYFDGLAITEEEYQSFFWFDNSFSDNRKNLKKNIDVTSKWLRF